MVTGSAGCRGVSGFLTLALELTALLRGSRERPLKTFQSGPSNLKDPRQLGTDLVQPATVRFSFFLQNPGDFGRGSHLRLRVLLELQIHHFLE